VTPAAELRYDACITVDGGYEPKQPIEWQTIVGGDYAVAKIARPGKSRRPTGIYMANGSRGVPGSCGLRRAL